MHNGQSMITIFLYFDIWFKWVFLSVFTLFYNLKATQFTVTSTTSFKSIVCFPFQKIFLSSHILLFIIFDYRVYRYISYNDNNNNKTATVDPTFMAVITTSYIITIYVWSFHTRTFEFLLPIRRREIRDIGTRKKLVLHVYLYIRL